MFLALPRLLQQTSCRCFTSRAATFNVYSQVNSPNRLTYPRSNKPYADLSIFPDNRAPERDPNNSWNNSLGDQVTGKDTTPEERWRNQSRERVPQLRQYPPADAYSGLIVANRRSVKFKAGDFAEGSRDLDRILARNRVRYTLRATERHEKKGVKRRRISSEQWRKHFAHQVRKNVQLVNKIRRKGA
ncbi:hypothetical protein B0H10DRAFT_1938928 [Mycena sp. CBHHK59/15]|nr:hypothetical protein B0H10DRAFT_1938928 [Mycena sp. CBHHK59/15]